MSAAEAAELMRELETGARPAAQIALAAAAEAFRLRPEFLRRQPREKRAEWVRRALSRPRSSAMAEEVLAEFFLSSGKDLLVELLDALGLEHDEGTLKVENPPCPPRDRLAAAVERFRKGEPAPRRELLLRAFAAQSAIDWPALEQLLEPQAGAA
jgi:hypothetical protein